MMGPERCGSLDVRMPQITEVFFADTGQCFSPTPGCHKSGVGAGESDSSKAKEAVTVDYRNYKSSGARQFLLLA